MHTSSPGLGFTPQVRLQHSSSTGPPSSVTPQGWGRVMWQTAREEGLGMWKGLPPRLIWVAPLSSVMFVYYELVRAPPAATRLRVVRHELCLSPPGARHLPLEATRRRLACFQVRMDGSCWRPCRPCCGDLDSDAVRHRGAASTAGGAWASPHIHLVHDAQTTHIPHSSTRRLACGVVRWIRNVLGAYTTLPCAEVVAAA